MPANEDTFGRLVSLAVHDLRTPLATLTGFARTLQRTDLGEPQNRYVEMMVMAGDQLNDLLEDLGLVARIESNRWEPNAQEADSRALADAVADRLAEADAAGDGATVRVDVDAATTALYQLARCAQRHGGVERVTVAADGTTVAISPIEDTAAPVIMREEIKDLGAVIAARIVEALGGSLELADDRLLVRLPS